ncbi:MULTISPECIES: hypothetical protein [unclassified Variovorax]|uniref:hypothetical protein n=1 Tax=unclassified Variovorax TaxID=663243 RepID=UPI0011AF23A9|nr:MULTISPECIES: hypothetical protein [unclassified Variovorax]
MRRHLWLIGCVMAHALSSSLLAEAARSHCDPGLQAAGARAIAYAERGDRCEGIYAQEVSGALRIVSFTRRSSNYRFSAERASLLRWPGVESGREVEVRASGLRRKLHYRMDTKRPSHPPAYTWPSDVLAQLELSRSEVGLLASTEQPVGEAMRRIVLPLDVTPTARPAEAAASASEYSVVLLCTLELQEVYVTLRALDVNGKPGRVLREGVGLDHGFYPAERPIVFRIPYSELDGGRMFSLSIGADLKNGEPRVVPEIVFLHAEPGR